MITLKFLWTWIKITALAALAFVIEYVVITSAWGFILAATITTGLWLLVTIGGYREWRARGTGYRHEVAEWVGPRPERRR